MSRPTIKSLIGYRLHDLAERALQVSDEWIGAVQGPIAASTGESITQDKALRISAVQACVRVIAETIGTLRGIVYRRGSAESGRARATDHPLYRLLHDKPNPEMTAFQAFETMGAHLALRGNSYWEIQKLRNGKVGFLWPLPPDKVRPKRERGSGEIVYEVFPPRGQSVTLRSQQVLHVKGLSNNGLYGYDPLDIMRESFGFADAVAKAGSKLFKNGLIPGGVYEAPNRMGPKRKKQVRRELARHHQGLDAVHRILLLEDGVKWHQLGLEPDKVEMLGSRHFSVEDIARIYRVPPHKIGHLEKATYSNIEHQSIEFLTDCVLPWTRRIESEINCKFFDGGGGPLYFEFLLEELLRADTESLHKALEIQFRNGALNLDEWRARMNLPALPDGLGQIHVIPVNYQNLMVLKGQTSVEEGEAGQPLRFVTEDGKVVTLLPVQRAHQHAGPSLQAEPDGAPTHRAWQKLFGDACDRVLRREKSQVLSRAGKAEDVGTLAATLGEYYRSEAFTSYFRVQMLPVCEAWAEANRSPLAPDVLVIAMRQAWAEKSVDSIRALLVARGAEGIGELEGLFETWASNRVAEFVSAMLPEAD